MSHCIRRFEKDRRELQENNLSFLEDTRKCCLAMREALAVWDYNSVAQQAHNIKGSGGICGFPRLSEIGLEIELAIYAGDDAGIRSALDHFSASLDEIQRGSRTTAPMPP